jgi:hypothetical protein
VASYLNLSVIVGGDDQVTLQPAFVTPAPTQPSFHGPASAIGPDATMTSQTFGDPQSLEPDRVLTIELIAGDYAVLSRNQWPLLPLCTDGGPTSSSMASGRISWTDETTAIRLYRGSRPIHIERLSEVPPRVRLAWDPPDPLVGSHVVRWDGSHPERRRLHYLVLYSHTGGRTWEPVAPPITANQLEVDFDDLPGGDAVIAVLASDGIRTERSETRTVHAPPKPLFAIIQSPATGDEPIAGTPVWLQGQAYDREAERPAMDDLVWTSSLQGELGRGAQLAVELVAGQHTITLRAGPEARRGQATTTLLVRRPPH